MTNPSGIWIDWKADGWDSLDEITSRVMSVTWNTGTAPDISGAAPVGSATIIVRNQDHAFDPDNASSPFYGYLVPARRVWFGINADGSMGSAATVYPLFAGYVREIAPQPLARTAEIVCEDLFGWLARTGVTLALSTTRSQRSYRSDVLTAAKAVALGGSSWNVDLTHCAEPHGLTLSGGETGNALSLLEALNSATGTRHFVAVGQRDTGPTYTALDRNYKLPNAYGSDYTWNAGTDHLVAIDGYRMTDQTLVNGQRASIAPYYFPPTPVQVWKSPDTPQKPRYDNTYTVYMAPTYVYDGTAEFSDYVLDGEVRGLTPTGLPNGWVLPNGATVTGSLTWTGKSVKFAFFSTTEFVMDDGLEFWGKPATRSGALSFDRTDAYSQSLYGDRHGQDRSGDLLANATATLALCDYLIWRGAEPSPTPTVTFQTAALATVAPVTPMAVVSLTSSMLSVSARRFEVRQVAGSLRLATANAADLSMTFTLHAMPDVADTFLVWGTSKWDDGSVWAY